MLLLRGLLRASAAAAACARPRAPDGPLPRLPRPAPPTSERQGWPAGPRAHVCLAVGPVVQGGWENVFADMGASVPVATGFVTLCGAAAYAYSLIAKRDVGVKALDEKLAALEGKLGKEMAGMVTNARSEAKAAALEVMKDYKVSAAGGRGQ